MVLLEGALSTVGPVELVQVVAVESVLGSEDSFSVLFLGRHRWHSAFHGRPGLERCDHTVMVCVVSGGNSQGYDY